MQIQIINGIYADTVADFRTSYPINMIPVPKQSGISEGYLRTVPGLADFATGFGIDRGGINWNGVMYRVSGDQLISISREGVVTKLGTVPGTLQCTLQYSFDDLGVCTNGSAYLWSPSKGFRKITDPDLGSVIDVVWIDGYWMYTDGTYLVQSELTDPMAFNPLKYGSSESDPDPIRAVTKLRNELYAINRYTTEVFQNVGGPNFAFQRVPGAVTAQGCVGPRAKEFIGDGIAFVGSGRNEPASVYYIQGNQSIKVATREIEVILGEYTEQELEAYTNLDNMTYYVHDLLIIYLPRHTLAWDKAASEQMQQPIWHMWSSQVDASAPFRGQNAVWCYEKWFVGDSKDGHIGHWDDAISTQYGKDVGWQFDTQLVFNETKGFIIHAIELSGLPGKGGLGLDPQIFHSYTKDGVTWSDEKIHAAGKQGEYDKRLRWRRLGMSRAWRGMRFRGANSNPIAFARLDAEMEPLNA